METPNMKSEVLEAIHLMFEDDPDIECDCYRYLASLHKNSTKTFALQLAALGEIEDMGYCSACGNRLENYSHKTEDGETLVEVYCPNCDVPNF